MAACSNHKYIYCTTATDSVLAVAARYSTPIYYCYAITVQAGKLDDREEHTSAVNIVRWMYCGAAAQEEMVPAASRRTVETLHSKHEQCTCAEKPRLAVQRQ
jgi:hypothetical protein